MHFLKCFIFVAVVISFLSSAPVQANRFDGIFSIRPGGASFRSLTEEQDSGTYHLSSTREEGLSEQLRELAKPNVIHAYTRWRDENLKEHPCQLTPDEIDEKLKRAFLNIDLVLTDDRSHTPGAQGLKIEDFHLSVEVPPPLSGHYFHAISVTGDMIQKVAVFEILKPSDHSEHNTSARGSYLLIEFKPEFELFRTMVIDRKLRSIALLTFYPLDLDAVVELYQTEKKVAVPGHPDWSQSSLQVARLGTQTLIRRNVEIISSSQSVSAACGDHMQSSAGTPVPKK